MAGRGFQIAPASGSHSPTIPLALILQRYSAQYPMKVLMPLLTSQIKLPHFGGILETRTSAGKVSRCTANSQPADSGAVLLSQTLLRARSGPGPPKRRAATTYPRQHHLHGPAQPSRPWALFDLRGQSGRAATIRRTNISAAGARLSTVFTFLLYGNLGLAPCLIEQPAAPIKWTFPLRSTQFPGMARCSDDVGGDLVGRRPDGRP